MTLLHFLFINFVILFKYKVYDIIRKNNKVRNKVEAKIKNINK